VPPPRRCTLDLLTARAVSISSLSLSVVQRSARPRSGFRRLPRLQSRLSACVPLVLHIAPPPGRQPMWRRCSCPVTVAIRLSLLWRNSGSTGDSGLHSQSYLITLYGRIISLSSWSSMWQCHT